ncbi:hypothetical protein PPERSA_05431 [Pseudocohnilembus persalinus]|uniref:Uncharacterized protein n=1 Tax=Pseudocohnilembus persalinus TaxID=266149 RepID=A0A0V0R7Z9_PSEPJ|nr:hypothetical protein PPERSA_05431 [Pseudocohnilembus persalinus]|eukprot:KRX10611.1 hypothetical protein PPERSA_05431 [Pseudocohnilembus persalinus]
MTEFYAKEDITIFSDCIAKQEQKTMNCLEFEEQVEKLNKDYQIISQFEKIDDQQDNFDLNKWNRQFRWDRLIQFDEDKLLQDISSQDIVAYVKYYFILLANVLTLQSIDISLRLQKIVYTQSNIKFLNSIIEISSLNFYSSPYNIEPYLIQQIRRLFPKFDNLYDLLVLLHLNYNDRTFFNLVCIKKQKKTPS